jgi:hypothetical protein
MAAPQDSQKSYAEEWSSSLTQTDKFDGYLIDLRKYGFTLLTGLITAGSFLSFSTTNQIVQMGVIVVTMVLVVVLYWIDVYYQNLLYGAVLRTRFLEIFRLNRALSVYISGIYGGTGMNILLIWLYIGFLIGLIVLGTIVLSVEVKIENTNTKVESNATGFKSLANTTNSAAALKTLVVERPPLWVLLLISFAFSVFVLFAIHVGVERRRDKRMQEILHLVRISTKILVSH